MTVSDNSAPRSNNTIIGIAIAVIVIITIIGIWFIKSQSSDSGEIRQITYEVTATGGYAQVIYTTSSGVNTEPAMVTTPFTKIVNLRAGDQVFLTASNPSQTGEVICKIKINGKDWKESKGISPIDSVACGGIIK